MIPRLVDQLRYWRMLRRTPKRYANLFRTIYRERPLKIVEIGTWNGQHAREMIQVAALHNPVSRIEYHGFDLFEDLTDEEYQREFSKRPPPMDQVRALLEETGARVRLHQGDTTVSLPSVLDEVKGADFIFIDGGHSPETVRSDWQNIEQILSDTAVVIFDDYYHNEEETVRELGCRSLTESLDRAEFEVDVLDPSDHFMKDWGVLEISMVRVVRRREATAE